MALERDFSLNPILESLHKRQKELYGDSETELAKRGVLFKLFKNANLFLHIITRITDKSTEFEPMDFLEEDGEITIIYKKWEIPLISTTQYGLETLAELLVPYITYNILYEAGQENDIDFYSSQYNLKQTSFFEIKEDTLYLKVSTYLEKYFDSDSLLIPNVKLLIHFKNPLEVSR